MTSLPAPTFLHIDLSLYAGRYIALLEGRVIAVAETAEAARAQAQVARPQRQATILHIAPSSDTAQNRLP